MSELFLGHPFIAPVIELARQAGEVILPYWRADVAVTSKADDSPVTAADLAAHHLILAGLTALDPSIPVLSEEDANIDQSVRAGWQRWWLVDPLDGTKEFVSRNGEFTVNIALIEEGRPVWGLVYAPVLDKLWYGGKEIGAWRVADGECEAIQVRPHREGTPWRVVGSRNHLSQATLDYLAPFGEIELVSMGSSLKFCIIAEGGAELYPRLAPTCEWDTAAAQAVLEGAGGSVTQLDGSALAYNKPDILNPWFVARA